MAEQTQSNGAESSPAPVVEVPQDRATYDHWRATGETTKPQAASAPAKTSSDAKPVDAGDGEGTGERQDAPESDTGKKQEHQPSKAERRLNELLADLKNAGLSPAELKTFKREAQKAAEPEKKADAVPEKTDKPAIDPDAPKRPKESDFKTWEEYEAAKDEYIEKLADYKARKAVESDRAQQRNEAAQKEMLERLNGAKQRYGDGADETIVETAKAIFQGGEVPGVIREVLNESDVLVDVLYTLGKDAESLSEFLDLAKSSPGQAMRKAVLVEKLVREELAKGSGKQAEAAAETPERGSDGKFVATPKKETKAPPPPKETSGRSGPPPDETERAIESGDFASYRAAANRRDLARIQGR